MDIRPAILKQSGKQFRSVSYNFKIAGFRRCPHQIDRQPKVTGAFRLRGDQLDRSPPIGFVAAADIAVADRTLKGGFDFLPLTVVGQIGPGRLLVRKWRG